MDAVVPKPPIGTRWYAQPAGAGWLALYLGPAEWTDEQMIRPNFLDLTTWPNSLPGLCGAEPDRVESMAHSLIRRFQQRFPHVAAAADVAAAINSGEGVRA